jgi:anti-sigma regulatory factor (Ser/Thr protein kinase)
MVVDSMIDEHTPIVVEASRIVDMEEPQVVQTLYFTAEPNAAGLTRALVRLVLGQWGLHELIDDAELVASELVTNAIQATGAYEPDWWVNGDRPPALVYVQVSLYQKFVVIGVWDRSLGSPKQSSEAHLEEDGRGLLIVESLSTRWGWESVHPYSGYRGKVVWAELLLPHAAVRPRDLPRRMPGRVIVGHPTPPDWRILQRTRDGLRRV